MASQETVEMVLIYVPSPLKTRYKLCIKYNDVHIGFAMFHISSAARTDADIHKEKGTRPHPTSRVLLVSDILIHDSYRRRHYFLLLHNILCLFGIELATASRPVEIHYKTSNAVVIHTLLKYYHMRAIHSERTVEVIDDRETIAEYQHIANDLGFLSRLGEIDIILPCDAENAIYSAIISDWLYKGGGLILPTGIVVL